MPYMAYIWEGARDNDGNLFDICVEVEFNCVPAIPGKRNPVDDSYAPEPAKVEDCHVTVRSIRDGYDDVPVTPKLGAYWALQFYEHVAYTDDFRDKLLAVARSEGET